MEIYHVLSRGIDKRKIFVDDQDYFRFIHDLFEFNDEKPANTTFYIFKRHYNDVGRRCIEFRDKNRELRKTLVQIHAFCMMPNHYHLLLTPAVENGIALFIKKLNGGYAKYFNEKYKRRGSLFEGKYKKILVDDEAHFIHLPYYIHLNPLDLSMPEWRDREIKNYAKAVNFLKDYRWSSHLDYLGIKNFPSVIYKKFLTSYFGGPQKYQKDITEWLKNIMIDSVEDVILE